MQRNFLIICCFRFFCFFLFVFFHLEMRKIYCLQIIVFSKKLNEPNVLQLVNQNRAIFESGAERVHLAMKRLRSIENNIPAENLLENESMEVEDQYQHPLLFDNLVGSASSGVDFTKTC